MMDEEPIEMIGVAGASGVEGGPVVAAPALARPILLSVLVLAGRRLSGLSLGYVRVVTRRNGKVASSERTQVCSFGSEPVWSDDAFSFEFANVMKSTLELEVYSVNNDDDGADVLRYRWTLPMMTLESTTGWIDMNRVFAGEEDTAVISDAPPQLNVAILFQYRSEPLQATLFRRHVPPCLTLAAFSDVGGEESIVSPAEDMMDEWLERLQPRQSSLIPILRLFVLFLIVVAVFVVQGVLLFHEPFFT